VPAIAGMTVSHHQIQLIIFFFSTKKTATNLLPSLLTDQTMPCASTKKGRQASKWPARHYWFQFNLPVNPHTVIQSPKTNRNASYYRSRTPPIQNFRSPQPVFTRQSFIQHEKVTWHVVQPLTLSCLPVLKAHKHTYYQNQASYSSKVLTLHQT
jgi:hypothetical protein